MRNFFLYIAISCVYESTYKLYNKIVLYLSCYFSLTILFLSLFILSPPTYNTMKVNLSYQIEQILSIYGSALRDTCTYLGQGGKCFLLGHIYVYVCYSTGVYFGLPTFFLRNNAQCIGLRVTQWKFGSLWLAP